MEETPKRRGRPPFDDNMRWKASVRSFLRSIEPTSMDPRLHWHSTRSHLMVPEGKVRVRQFSWRYAKPEEYEKGDRIMVNCGDLECVNPDHLTRMRATPAQLASDEAARTREYVPPEERVEIPQAKVMLATDERKREEQLARLFLMNPTSDYRETQLAALRDIWLPQPLDPDDPDAKWRMKCMNAAHPDLGDMMSEDVDAIGREFGLVVD